MRREPGWREVTSRHGKCLRSGAQWGRSLTLSEGHFTEGVTEETQSPLFCLFFFFPPCFQFFVLLPVSPRQLDAGQCSCLSPAIAQRVPGSVPAQGHTFPWGGSGCPRSSSAVEASAPHWEWTSVPRRFMIYFYNDKP